MEESALTLQPELLPASAHEQPKHQEQLDESRGEIKNYVLRSAIAVLAFTVGIIAATALFYRPVPPATIPPLTMTDVVAEEPSGCEARPAAQERHTISRRVVGYVRDHENRSAAGAKVCAKPHNGIFGRHPCGVSKADGSFTLDVWQTGTYTISAEDLVTGYPDATNGFYGKFFGGAPSITVGESDDLVPIEVRLGSKAGKVSLQIVDDQSGRPIKSGLVRVCRTDNPQMCISTSTAFPHGRYELLAPEVPFTIEFKVWRKDWERRDAVDGDGAPVRLLRVESGARRELLIRLRRVHGSR